MNVFPGNPAQASETPVFPDWRTTLLVGGVVGLGFGVAFALTRTASDRRIRSGEEASEKLGHPVVGTIPERPVEGKKNSRTKDTTFAFDESMRVLRTNLQFMDVDHPPRTIVVTSPTPGDGKSTVSCELALTLAASGTPTVLIDGDLRRPTVASKMGLPAGAGLSDVLAGRATVTELLQRVPGVANLLVLTAGTVPPNPSEILGSDRMHELLGYLSTEATVIIDAPPLLPVTDGAVLAHQSDGALVVVTAGKTTYELAGKAFEALANARGRALGMVINKAPMRGVDASPYAYAYYTYYSHNDPAPSAEAASPAHPAAAQSPVSPPAGPQPQRVDEAYLEQAPTAQIQHVAADDPFTDTLAQIDESLAQATVEHEDLDMLNSLLEQDDPAPRTTRDRSRRS
jgi:capsular exopolysaccharide synthesis family protein